MSTDLKPAALPAELERRLERQEAAIAWLMERFPPRANPIGEARLHEILRALVDQAQILFPGRTVAGTAVPEHDPETTAVHHLVLRVEGGREIEVDDFVERTFELLRYAACHLSPEEFEAVLIGVE